MCFVSSNNIPDYLFLVTVLLTLIKQLYLVTVVEVPLFIYYDLVAVIQLPVSVFLLGWHCLNSLILQYHLKENLSKNGLLYLKVTFCCCIRIHCYESFSTALFQSALLLTWVNTYLYLYTFKVIKCRKKNTIPMSQAVTYSSFCKVEIFYHLTLQFQQSC